MEIESNNSLLFLDVLITQLPDVSLTHRVYRKRHTLIIIFMLILTTTHPKNLVFLKPLSLAPLNFSLPNLFPQRKPTYSKPSELMVIPLLISINHSSPFLITYGLTLLPLLLGVKFLSLTYKGLLTL